MGLSLHFELRLPATTSPEQVTEILQRLHAEALRLPFASVTPFLSRDIPPTDDEGFRFEELEFWASIVAPEPDEVDTVPQGIPETAVGFFVIPGDGCEPASFALMRRNDATGVPVDWYWRCHCKTQYASTVSDAHFVTCHTTLIRLLDSAGALGLQLDVHDEAQFWETRDEVALLAELSRMNQLIAGFAGRMHDAIGETHDVKASIFEHPRFERLEMGSEE
ncbi:MAG: hypothetical protein V4813_04805 [Gemmatimonadota bacterium]